MTKEWLLISDAAKILGVHPSTIRLWSDKNVLPTHKTQGGHRRYKRDEILLWAEANNKTLKVADENLMQEIIKTIHIQISEGKLEAQAWYQKLDEEARAQYRTSGRSLFHGLMAYVASDGADAASEAYAIGYQYASRARRYAMNYVDAVKAFLFFRDALIEALIKVYGDAKVPADQTSQIYTKIHTFTDDILVSLLETYHSLELLHK